MTDCILEDLSRGRRLLFQVNGQKPSFTLRTERISAAAVRNLDDEVQDLLDVAAAVFYADSDVSRGGSARSQMGTDWHRQLRLTIPVRCLDLWRSADVQQKLKSAVDFLTGDHFEFEFSQADYPLGGSEFLNLDPSEGAFHAEKVIMFSGGLDSFAGSLESLETGGGNVILVSHQSAPKIATRQRYLAEYLGKRFPGRMRHIMVPAHRTGAESRDTTQRSRSFLFAAMGSAIACTFGARTVSFFENGIVSHNLPISPQIVGTMASRTTHPLSLFKLQSVINLVLHQAPSITNPYEWMTKTEVIERISRYSGEKMIEAAVSCTKVRDQTTLHTHCGSCSQCLDRRFAILSARLADADPSSRYENDVILGSSDFASPTLPVEWTKHHLQITQMDESSFLARFGMELSRIFEAYPETTREALFRRILDLHHRQAKIVLQVLRAQVEQNSEGLANRSLPQSCLLVLHLGHSDQIPMPTRPTAPVEQLRDEPDDGDEEPPRPGDPLTLMFEDESGKQTVHVLGLCSFTRKIAKITFVLKKQFETDQLDGIAPDQFKFIHPAYAGSLSISKSELRVLISRGRRSLATAYLEMIGEEPAESLLFQTKQSRGYRLNPATKIKPPT